MRLVQLARKLGVTQNEIIRFLSNQGIDIGQSGNVKVADEHIQLIYSHFGHPVEETVEEETMDKTATEPLILSSQTISETIETPQTEQAEAIDENKDEEERPAEVRAEETEDIAKEKDKQEKVEVIRAKKIKLEGIKVLGKIDLPEPPKKEESTDESEDQPKSEPRGGRRKDFKDRKSQKRQNPKRRKSESYEQKLKRQEREAERKKREREKKLKEKKKRFYEEQVKSVQPEKVKKKASKKQVKKQGVTIRKKVIKKHSNPIIRFWEWLNGKYD